MKRLLILLVCALSASLLLSGCRKLGHDEERAVEVIIEGGGEFPQFLVGRWEAEIGRLNWTFEFQPDGSILKMNHSMAGQVDLTQDGAYIEIDKPPVHIEYLLAPCQAEYDPATNEVSIEVITVYFKIQSLDAAVEGSRTDLFEGPLSENGKTWNADWLSSFEIKDKKPLKSRKPSPLVFTRVDAP